MAYVIAARECGPGVQQFELLMLGGAPGKVNAQVWSGVLYRWRPAGSYDCKCGRGLRLWREREEQKSALVGLGGPSLRVGGGESCSRKSRRDASGTLLARTRRTLLDFGWLVRLLVEFFYADYFVT
jgi:hypothetical protein